MSEKEFDKWMKRFRRGEWIKEHTFELGMVTIAGCVAMGLGWIIFSSWMGWP